MVEHFGEFNMKNSAKQENTPQQEKPRQMIAGIFEGGKKQLKNGMGSDFRGKVFLNFIPAAQKVCPVFRLDRKQSSLCIKRYIMDSFHHRYDRGLTEKQAEPNTVMQALGGENTSTVIHSSLSQKTLNEGSEAETKM